MRRSASDALSSPSNSGTVLTFRTRPRARSRALPCVEEGEHRYGSSVPPLGASCSSGRRERNGASDEARAECSEPKRGAGGKSARSADPLAPNLEAPPGFEPGMEVLQTSALPLGDGAARRRFPASWNTASYQTLSGRSRTARSVPRWAVSLPGSLPRRGRSRRRLKTGTAEAVS